jgi:hypothetical protein
MKKLVECSGPCAPVIDRPNSAATVTLFYARTFIIRWKLTSRCQIARNARFTASGPEKSFFSRRVDLHVFRSTNCRSHVLD